MAAAALALMLALGAARLLALPGAPVLDPVEAREFQLAAILAGQGWDAFAAALAPGEIGTIGGVLAVALTGGLGGGFDDPGLLRLPGFAALALAALAIFRAGRRLTGRRSPAAVMAAALYAAPSSGLILLSSTSDALMLLCIAVVVAALANLMRWGGDARLLIVAHQHTGEPVAREKPLYLPPYDPDADSSEKRHEPGFGIDADRRTRRADAHSVLWFWLAAGMSVWVAGAAVGLFAAAAAGLSWVGFRSGLVSQRPGIRGWEPGRLRTRVFLPFALALALLPLFVGIVAKRDPGLAWLAGLIDPRPHVDLYPSAPLGHGASLLLLVWPVATLLPLFVHTRIRFGAFRETFVIAMVAVWVPVAAFASGSAGPALGFGTVALALMAGFLANYVLETRIRGRLPVPVPRGGEHLWPWVSGGLMIAGAGATAAVLAAADDSGTYLAIGFLIVAAVAALGIVVAASEHSAAGLCLTGLAVAGLLEIAAAGAVAPGAHRVWPDWRVAAVLAPLRSCGADRIADRTGFDPGFLYHAGPGAVGPGMVGAGLAAVEIRTDPRPGWREIARLSLSPPGGMAPVHVYADPAARGGDGLVAWPDHAYGIDPERAWADCLRALTDD